ncbi:MAG: AcrR family transcriptional regulator [Alloalcanivorax sp.]
MPFRIAPGPDPCALSASHARTTSGRGPCIYARASDTLADEAGVSSGTLYNDFRSREQVLEAVGLELAVSEAVDSGAERLSIAVRTFMNKARTDPDWTRTLITVVRYAEGMRSALATYLRADLQAGRRQGDFHYAHEEMAMSMVISATLGAMNLLVEDGEVEHADRIASEMVLQALGVPPEKAKRIAGLPLPGEGG